MKAKLYIYNGLIFLAGPLGMIFSKVLLIKIIGHLILIVTGILIYRDKEYRKKYLPSFPSWAMVILLLFFLVLSGYSVWLSIRIRY